MNIKIFSGFIFIFLSSFAKSQVADNANSAGVYRPANMVVVEGGTIPKWSASTFENQLEELKEDPLEGASVKNSNDLIKKLRNETSRSIFQGEKVKTFMIADVETTWGEWKAVLQWAKEHDYKNLDNTGFGSADDHPVRVTSAINMMIWCNAKSEMEGLKPVYKIKGRIYRDGPETKNSIYPKIAYLPEIDLKANGYRLPTEIEWEWAALGGTQSQGYLFSGGNKPNEVAWHGWNTENTIEPYDYTIPPPHASKNLSKSERNKKTWAQGTMPVALKKPNELGLYDMSGNVGEVCGEGAQKGASFQSDFVLLPTARSCTKEPLKHNYNNQPYPKPLSNPFAGFRLARNYSF